MRKNISEKLRKLAETVPYASLTFKETSHIPEHTDTGVVQESSNKKFWDVFDGKDKVGLFGVYTLGDREGKYKGKQFTDIEVYSKFQGKGYAKRIYNQFLKTLWNHQPLYGFVKPDNAPSIALHTSLGAKLIEKIMDGDKVHNLVYKYNTSGGF